MASTPSLTATPQTPTTILAALNDVFVIEEWTLTLEGAEVPIAAVEALSDRSWTITTEVLLPGRTYLLEVVTDGGTDDDDFLVPTTTPWIDYTQWPLPFPKKLLEATTYAFGKELQYLGGQPETHLTHNYTAGDAFFRVGSTLGAQHSGTAMVNGMKFTYTSKTQTALLGVSGDWMFSNIPRGAKVVFSPKTARPPTRTPGIPVGDAYKTIETYETKALAFDGLVDYALAEGVINGTANYTVFVKLLVGNPAGSFKNIFHTIDSDVAGPNDFAQWSDLMQTSGASPQYYRYIGLQSNGGSISYQRQSSSDGVTTTGAGVLVAISRTFSPNLAQVRVIRTDTGGVVWAPTALSVTSGTTPDALALGGGLNKTRVPVAGYYSPIRLVSVGVIDGSPSTADLAAYARRQAIPSEYLSSVSHYWSLDRLENGATSVAPLIGTEPLLLYGPGFADLLPVP